MLDFFVTQGERGPMTPTTAALLAVLFAAYLKRRLGGITGDTIGASIELAEILSFLVFLLVWKFLL